MKILMQARQDIFVDKGGDTIQLLRTKEALQRKDIEVEITSEYNIDLSEYDIIHLFNLKGIEFTYLQFLNAKKQKKPLVLSPIYWKLYNEEKKQFQNQIILIYGKTKTKYLQKIKEGLKKISLLYPIISWYTKINKKHRYQPPMFYRLRREIGEKQMQMEVLQGTDILLPNSEDEIEMLFKNFGIVKDYIIVPNGVDLKYEKGRAEDFYKKYGIRNFILCVARIEERKNQLSVIRALKNTNFPLVFIGEPREPYFSICKREAVKNVYFLGHIEGNELRSAYAAAKVHVLASWYETPGLSSLEAALAGCNIVVSTKGSTKEYFKNYAEYCDPGNIVSIRDAILRALKKPYTDNLKKFIKRHYVWDKAAKKTLEAYNRVIKRKQ